MISKIEQAVFVMLPIVAFKRPAHPSYVGKWPSSAAALRKVKAALGVQLALALETAHGLTCRASEEFVDVLSDGFAFRLRLHCSRYVVS